MKNIMKKLALMSLLLAGATNCLGMEDPNLTLGYLDNPTPTVSQPVSPQKKDNLPKAFNWLNKLCNSVKSKFEEAARAKAVENWLSTSYFGIRDNTYIFCCDLYKKLSEHKGNNSKIGQLLSTVEKAANEAVTDLHKDFTAQELKPSGTTSALFKKGLDSYCNKKYSKDGFRRIFLGTKFSKDFFEDFCDGSTAPSEVPFMNKDKFPPTKNKYQLILATWNKKPAKGVEDWLKGGTEQDAVAKYVFCCDLSKKISEHLNSKINSNDNKKIQALQDMVKSAADQTIASLHEKFNPTSQEWPLVTPHWFKEGLDTYCKKKLDGNSDRKNFLDTKFSKEFFERFYKGNLSLQSTSEEFSGLLNLCSYQEVIRSRNTFLQENSNKNKSKKRGTETATNSFPQKDSKKNEPKIGGIKSKANSFANFLSGLLFGLRICERQDN